MFLQFAKYSKGYLKRCNYFGTSIFSVCCFDILYIGTFSFPLCIFIVFLNIRLALLKHSPLDQWILLTFRSLHNISAIYPSLSELM
jgi:hypothetical protein